MHKTSLLALGVLVAVFFIVGSVWAADSGAQAQAKGKADAAKNGQQTVTPASGSKLEARLKALQAALEKVTDQRNGKIPYSIDNLVDALDEGKNGLVNPESNGKIIMNNTMVGKWAQQIADPATFITFYADKDTPNKGRAVIYASGDIAYLNADDLKKGLAASSIRAVTGPRDGQNARGNARDAADRERR